MQDLEQIVMKINNSNLEPSEIVGIENMLNANNQNALTIATSLGLDKAVSKLLKPIIRYSNVERFIPGEMERQAEINGNGMNTTYQKPQKNIEVEPEYHYLDIFKKDNFGKTAFDYALMQEDKSILAKIYLSGCDSRLYSVKFNRKDGQVDGLRYFISELCRAKKFGQATKAFEDIVSELSKVKPLVSSLHPSSFTAFASILFSYNYYPSKYIDVFENLCSEVSPDALNLCYNQTILNANGENLVPIIFAVHQELLKYGANINQEQVDALRNKVTDYAEKNKANTVQKIFDDTYTINPSDFKTIVGKPKQVIEMYFKKDYKEVFKEYIEKGLVDYDSLVIASQCKYDLEKEREIQDTRIGLLAELGANISITNELGESIFEKLNERQVADIFKKDSNVMLSDIDILAIANKKYNSAKIPIEISKKIFDTIISHQVTGNIDEYKTKLMKGTRILYEFDINRDFFDYDVLLENSLNDQFRKKLEEEKKKLNELQKSSNIIVSENSIEQNGPKL